LLSRRSEIIGLAMGTMPGGQVVRKQKSARRKNQNNEAPQAER
jgi:hypothetical protein